MVQYHRRQREAGGGVTDDDASSRSGSGHGTSSQRGPTSRAAAAAAAGAAAAAAASGPGMSRRGSGPDRGKKTSGAPALACGREEAGGGGAAALPPPPPALSPRYLSAESRLAQEKAWLLDDLPPYCNAEAIRGTGFVWSFKVAGLHGTLYQEIGKVAFRAHFPRDYPSTPPTLLLTEELIHPNWKYPARGLQVPHLTKEGWDPDTTIPKMLLKLREIIQRPDVSALSLMWREGSGLLVDGGSSLDATGQLDTEQLQPISSPTARAAAAAGGGGERGAPYAYLSGAGGTPRNRRGDVAVSPPRPPPTPPPPPPELDDPPRLAKSVSAPAPTPAAAAAAAPAASRAVTAASSSSAGAPASSESSGAAAGSSGSGSGSNSGGGGGSGGGPMTTTAAGWTAARKGIDRELALLYLLDVAAFRGLVVRHQHHLGQAAQAAAVEVVGAAAPRPSAVVE